MKAASGKRVLEIGVTARVRAGTRSAVISDLGSPEVGSRGRVKAWVRAGVEVGL